MNEIVKQENISAIVANAPKALEESTLSMTRCNEYGKNLLSEIEAAGGMTDELDKKSASYIEKAKRTIKKMNEIRSPVTKLFDQIRQEYTRLENAIDVTKAGTVPYQVQQLRNEYAAKLRAEALRRQQEELRKQKIEVAKQNYSHNVEEEYKAFFYHYVDAQVQSLQNCLKELTLANYEQTVEKLEKFPRQYPIKNFPFRCDSVLKPAYLSDDDCDTIRKNLIAKLQLEFKEAYEFEISSNWDYVTKMLSSKKKSLEEAEKASAEEKARIQAEIKAREEADKARQEEERKQREREAEQKAELEKSSQQALNLFNAEATKEQYAPKTKVKKRIEVLAPEGYTQIISMWWSHEGCKMPTEELAKVLKRQVTFCEKLANASDPILIDNKNIQYVDEVKAK